MKIKSRQLIHYDAHGHILSHAAVHTGGQTIEDKGVQRTDNALHFRVIGNDQVTRIGGVTHLQVKLVPVPVEYPERFLCRQA